MPSDLESNLTLKKLREFAPQAVEEAREFRGEITIYIRPDMLIRACEFLRDEPGLSYQIPLRRHRRGPLPQRTAL